MVFFLNCYYFFFIKHSVSKQWKTNQMLCCVAPDLGLRYLSMPHKKDVRLIMVYQDH